LLLREKVESLAEDYPAPPQDGQKADSLDQANMFSFLAPGALKVTTAIPAAIPDFTE
jgi:hypothetical protein